MLKQIEKKPVIRDCCRVTGMRKSNSKRPINFTLRSSDMVNQILRKAKILRTKKGYKFNSIYISIEKTVEAIKLKAYKQLLEELNSKRITDFSKVNYIKND